MGVGQSELVYLDSRRVHGSSVNAVRVAPLWRVEGGEGDVGDGETRGGRREWSVQVWRGSVWRTDPDSRRELHVPGCSEGKGRTILLNQLVLSIPCCEGLKVWVVPARNTRRGYRSRGPSSWFSLA